MIKKSFTFDELVAAHDSAQHVVNGILGIWKAAEGAKAVRLAEQVKDAYEADFVRLLRGVPTLQAHIHAHLNPDHGLLPKCGEQATCRNADSCKNCSYYENFKEKLRENFRN